MTNLLSVWSSDRTSAAFTRLLLASFVIVPLIAVSAHVAFPNTTAAQAVVEILLILVSAAAFGALQLVMIRMKENEHDKFVQNLTDNLSQTCKMLDKERLHYVELQHALGQIEHLQNELAQAIAQNGLRDAYIKELGRKLSLLRQANHEIQQLADIFVKHQQLNHKELYVVADDLKGETDDLLEQVGTSYYKQSLERLLEYTARTSHALVQEFETMVVPKTDSEAA